MRHSSLSVFSSPHGLSMTIVHPTICQKTTLRHRKCIGGWRSHPIKSKWAWVFRRCHIKYHGRAITTHTRARRSRRARSPMNMRFNRGSERQFEGRSQCRNCSYTLTLCTTRHYMQTTIGSDLGSLTILYELAVADRCTVVSEFMIVSTNNSN